MTAVTAVEFVHIRAAGSEFASLGRLIRAAEANIRTGVEYRALPVWGVDAAGGDHYLGDLVVEAGAVGFTAIEPDGPEGEG